MPACVNEKCVPAATGGGWSPIPHLRGYCLARRGVQERRSTVLHKRAAVIQSVWRMVITRRRFLRLKICIVSIQVRVSLCGSAPLRSSNFPFKSKDPFKPKPKLN